MRKNLNRVHLQGYLYQHSLQKRVTGEASKNPGTEYISGEIEIATDEEGLNVVPVHFSYVTAITNKGKKNPNYDILTKIINEGKTWIADGKDNAMKFSINASYAVNDFYNQEGTLVSAKRLEGGWINSIAFLSTDPKERNEIEADMLINNITIVEANEEKGTEEYVAVRGYFFSYRNDILPIELTNKSKAAIKFFESLEVSDREPLYTKVWGTIKNETVKIEKVEETSFGEPRVTVSTRNVREWIISSTAKEPYELGEGSITGEELQTALQNRETYLADVKRRQEEYQASRTAAAATPTPAAPVKAKTGDFKF